MADRKLAIFISHPSPFLTNCKLYGDGLAAYEFITRLAQRGHQLHIAFSSKELEGPLPDNVYFYGARLWTPFSTLNTLEYIIRVKAIFNEIRRHHKIDIIHQLNPVVPGLSVALSGLEVPLVLGLFWPNWPADADLSSSTTSLLGTIGSILTKPLIKQCDRIQQRKAAALLLSTPAALTRIYHPEACQNKIHFLPCGIDPGAFLATEVSGSDSSKEDLNILFLASLSYRKGIYTLLDAFEQVVTDIPKARLLIAGSGPELERVMQKISAMSCQNRISLLGFVSRDRVPEVMRQCSVYCLPSYGEPFGISALEAMACGKPVVGTDAGGLAYLVSEQGGRKVMPGDAHALAQALIEILSSSKLRIKMGQYNSNLARQKYNWDTVIDQLESIYYQILPC